MAAFAVTFTCLWRAFQAGRVFDQVYASHPAAFHELRSIVTPNVPEAGAYTACARFWVHDQQQQVTAIEEYRRLYRTLRNGFGHFNFRYVDVTPREYFGRLGQHLPAHIPDPDEAMNYRIFILDWNNRNHAFMDPSSDTRIIETHFAHLRYHLFKFLARFFAGHGAGSFKDILNDGLIA